MILSPVCPSSTQHIDNISRCTGFTVAGAGGCCPFLNCRFIELWLFNKNKLNYYYNSGELQHRGWLTCDHVAGRYFSVTQNLNSSSLLKAGMWKKQWNIIKWVDELGLAAGWNNKQTEQRDQPMQSPKMGRVSKLGIWWDKVKDKQKKWLKSQVEFHTMDNLIQNKWNRTAIKTEEANEVVGRRKEEIGVGN